MCSARSMGTQIGRGLCPCPSPSSLLQEVLQVTIAPHLASKIPLVLGLSLLHPADPSTARHWFKLYQSPERLLGLPARERALRSTASCHQVPGLGQPCATNTAVLSAWQLPTNCHSSCFPGHGYTSSQEGNILSS